MQGGSQDDGIVRGIVLPALGGIPIRLQAALSASCSGASVKYLDRNGFLLSRTIEPEKWGQAMPIKVENAGV